MFSLSLGDRDGNLGMNCRGQVYSLIKKQNWYHRKQDSTQWGGNEENRNFRQFNLYVNK